MYHAGPHHAGSIRARRKYRYSSTRVLEYSSTHGIVFYIQKTRVPVRIEVIDNDIVIVIIIIKGTSFDLQDTVLV